MLVPFKSILQRPQMMRLLLMGLALCGSRFPTGGLRSTHPSNGRNWVSPDPYSFQTQSIITFYQARQSQLTKHTGASKYEFTIPPATSNGNYLVWIEKIALHSASMTNGAQFYIACGQISVTGGGNGSPGPKVALPGDYSASDPGILFNTYYPTVLLRLSRFK